MSVQIKSLVGEVPNAGLGPQDAERIFHAVTGGGKVDAKARKTLEQVGELYASSFAKSGRAAWEAITGLELPQAKAVKKGDRAGRTRAVGSKSGAVARHILDRAGATPPASISFDLKKADGLFTQRTLEKVLPGTPVIASAMDELRAVEKTYGDGDGMLAPRDLPNASLAMRSLMERVYKKTGRKLLSLEEIEDALPKAFVDLFRLRAQRTTPGLAGWYKRMIGDAIARVAEGYHQEVVSGSKRLSQFTTGWGFSFNAPFSEMRRRAPSAFPAPNVDEIAELYQRVLSNKLRPKEFYAITRVLPADIAALREIDERFELPGGRVQGALPQQRRRNWSEKEVDTLSQAWNDEVLDGGKSLAVFCAERELDPSVIFAFRKEHPGKFEEVAKSVVPAGGVPQKVADCAALVHGLMERDPTLSWKDLLEAVNGDKKFTAQHGTITRGTFHFWTEKYRDEFPKFRTDAWMEPIAEYLAEVKASKGTLTWDRGLAAVRERFKHFSGTRLQKIAKKNPDLFRAKKQTFTEEQEAAIASRIKKLLAKTPNPTRAALVENLSGDYPKLSVPILDRILDRHQIELPTRRLKLMERQSLPAKAVLELLLKISPPGSNQQALGEAYNKALEARGLPPYEAFKGLFNDMPLSEHRAKITSEIVAEYARAAKKGTSEQEIFAAVRADYPHLAAKALTECRKAWVASPADFPALKSFFQGSELVLAGRDGKVSAPRYLGGWDVKRYLDNASPEESKELARLEQLSRIPLRLPLLDAVVEKMGGKQPLESDNVLWVSHVLADNVPMAFALRALGARTNRTVVVGTPYGSSPVVAEALRAEGIQVEAPKLDVDAYRAAVKKGIDAIVAKHKENGLPIVVIDDGGLVTEILHSDPAYKEVRKSVKIVEQTTGGIILAEKHALDTPVVAAARAKCKKAEAEFIGTTVTQKLLHALERLGDDLSKDEAVIVGGGWIGQAVAVALQDRVKRLRIIEPSEERAMQCKDRGFEVSSSDSIASEADLLIGATGKPATKFERLAKSSKKRIKVVSVSSKRVEFPMKEVEAAASDRIKQEPKSPYHALPTTEYVLDDKSIVAIGDGWPVNFDGDVRATPTELIQLTLALLLLGAVQAGRTANKIDGENKILDLDPELDEWLLGCWNKWRSENPGEIEVSNPDRWRERLIAWLGK